MPRPAARGNGHRLQSPPTRPRDDAIERTVEARGLLARLAEATDADTFETFILFYESGLSRVELAELLGCDRKTVYNRITRAHERLQGCVSA